MNDLEKLRIKRRKLRQMTTAIFNKIDMEVTKDNISCCRNNVEQYLEQLLAKHKKISTLDAQIEIKINIGSDLDAEILDSEKWRETFVDYKSKINMTFRRLDSEISQNQHCKPMNICRPAIDSEVHSISNTEKHETNKLKVLKHKLVTKELKVKLQRLNLPIWDKLFSEAARCSSFTSNDDYDASFVPKMENSYNDDTNCDSRNIINNEVEDLVVDGLSSECLTDSTAENGSTFVTGEFTQETCTFINKHPIANAEVPESTEQKTSNEITIELQEISHQEHLNSRFGSSINEISGEKELGDSVECFSTIPPIDETVNEFPLKIDTKSNNAINLTKMPRTEEKQTTADLTLPLDLEGQNGQSVEENFNSQAAKIMDLLNYLDNLNKSDFPSTELPSTSTSTLNKDTEQENFIENKVKHENVQKEMKNNDDIEIIDLESDEEMILGSSIINHTLNSHNPHHSVKTAIQSVLPNVSDWKDTVSQPLRIARIVTLSSLPTSSEKKQLLSSQSLGHANLYTSGHTSSTSMLSLALSKTNSSASIVTPSLTESSKCTVTFASPLVETAGKTLLSGQVPNNDVNYQRYSSPLKNTSGAIELIDLEEKVKVKKTKCENLARANTSGVIFNNNDVIELIELESDEETSMGRSIEDKHLNSFKPNLSVNPLSTKITTNQNNAQNVGEQNMSNTSFHLSSEVIGSVALSQTPSSVNTVTVVASSLAPSTGSTVTLPSYCTKRTKNKSLFASSHADTTKSTMSFTPAPCNRSIVPMASSHAPTSLQVLNFQTPLILTNNTTSYQLTNNSIPHIPMLTKIASSPVSLPVSVMPFSSPLTSVVTDSIINCVASRSAPSSYTIENGNDTNIPLSKELSPINNQSIQLNTSYCYDSHAPVNLHAGNQPHIGEQVQPILAINKTMSQNTLYVNPSNTSQLLHMVQTSGVSFARQQVEVSLVTNASGYVLFPKTASQISATQPACDPTKQLGSCFSTTQ